MQNQVLGRGKLYFELYAPGTFVGQGERYLGNTPAFALRSTVAMLDEYDSLGETIEKVESTTTQQDLGASFTGDDISNDNLAAWFAADQGSTTQVGMSGLQETLTLFRDRWYQLGKPSNPPMGVRNIQLINASVGGSPVDVTPNLSFDRPNGRVYVLPEAPVISGAGTVVTLTYDTGDNTRKTLIHKTQKVRGALRFISANAEGTNTTYYFPYVTLQPAADFNLKTDDWQKLGFSVNILKMNAVTDRVYTDSETTSEGFTPNEQEALTFGTPAQIIAWANSLEYVIDTQLPSLNYP